MAKRGEGFRDEQISVIAGTEVTVSIMDAEQWATIVTCNLVNWPSLHSHRLTYCYHLIYKNITGKLTAYVASRLCLNDTNMNGFIYIKNVSIIRMCPRRFWETKSLRVDYSLVALKVTFLSGDFMANTGMWQASSGHQSGAIVFPSFSPHSHPGEFSSPETKGRKLFTEVVLCVVFSYFTAVFIDSTRLLRKVELGCKLSFELCQTTQN